MLDLLAKTKTAHKMKTIAQLQYIGAATAIHTQLQMIEAMLKVGVRWVQLRLKGETKAGIYEIGQQVRELCNQYEATFILNDHPAIAKAIGADGVHLGQKDMPTLQARELLGDHFIIGGTANTWEEVKQFSEEGAVNYIGLGPLRFTLTKKKLSPVLGIEGYQKMIDKCQKHDIQLPIVAIGGIQIEDIADVMQTGVHGIAISSLLNNASDKKAILRTIHQQLSNQ